MGKATRGTTKAELEAEIRALEERIADMEGAAASSRPAEPASAWARGGPSPEEQRLLAQFSLDHAADGAYWVAPDGRFLYVNEGACCSLGYSREELLGMHAWEIEPPRETNDWPHRWEEIRRRKSFTFETQHRRKDGTVIPVEMSVNYMEYAGQAYNCVFSRDISERKQTEQRLAEYTSALEAANRNLEEYSFSALAATRAKSEFLANMSHEIRTPLTAIMGFAESILIDGDITRAPAQRVDAIQTILRNTKYLLGLLNEILDLSKIEAGRLEVERVPCNLIQVIGDVFRLMRMRAEAKRLSLTVDCEGPIPETIHSDPTRLRQILINLLSNAVKFTATGSVKLSVRLLEDNPARRLIELAVSDTGMGMTAKQVATLFQPFHQADSTTSRRFGGTGLGLSICKHLVENLGGTIRVSSEPGKGSTFAATIETGSLEGIARVRPSIWSTAAARTDQAVTAAAGALRLSGRVLLAEDAPDNRRLIGLLLAKAGARVETAEDGQSAFEKAMDAFENGEPFDLVLMDMQMPVLDGWQATQRLRKAGYRGKIVALTANAMAGERDKCLAAGCDDYAVKPIERAALLTLVAHHCGQATPANPR